MLGAAFVVLLLVVMASALHRMVLYQQEFGLTADRLFATAFLGGGGGNGGVVPGHGAVGATGQFMRGAIAGWVVWLVALHAVNPEAVIVRANVARAEAGKPPDTAHLLRLGNDAAPGARWRRCPGSGGGAGQPHLGPPPVGLELPSDRWKEPGGVPRGTERADHHPLRGSLPVTNMTIPMPVSVLAFLGTIAGTGLLLLVAVWALVRRQDRAWKLAMIGAASLVAAYATALLGVAAVSRDRVLAAGEEKYFCEIDCHLAYHVAEAGPDGEGRWEVTLVTRFDPATTSPARPADAPLHPGPRLAILRLEDGREVAGAVTGGRRSGRRWCRGSRTRPRWPSRCPRGSRRRSCSRMRFPRDDS